MNGNAARSGHPLVVLLRELRERHPEVTLTEIEACMGIPFDTLRHIEKGRRRCRACKMAWAVGFFTCSLHACDTRGAPDGRDTAFAHHPDGVERSLAEQERGSGSFWLLLVPLPFRGGAGEEGLGEVAWFMETSISAREGMADVGSSLTPDSRRDIAWALGASLAQVAPGELGSSALADSGNARQTGSVPRTILSRLPNRRPFRSPDASCGSYRKRR